MKGNNVITVQGAARFFLVPMMALAVTAAPSAGAQERREVPGFAVFGEAAPGARAEIDAFIAAFKSAWSSQDAAALAALHTADTEWINAYARIFCASSAETAGSNAGKSRSRRKVSSASRPRNKRA